MQEDDVQKIDSEEMFNHCQNGFHRDPSLLTKIIKETREYEGDVYQKAAFLLKAIITTHIFRDGQHRAAFVTVEMFLRRNGEVVSCNAYGQARNFLKRIRWHSVDEIAEWLRHGHP